MTIASHHGIDIKNVTAIVVPIISSLGYVLVRLSVKGSKSNTLQIMAERIDGTMNVDDCAKISRALSVVLDVEGIMPDHYVLEISSPGIDRPLINFADYQRFINYMVQIEMSSPVMGRKRWKGKIVNIDSDNQVVFLQVEGNEVTLPYALIEQGQLIITDELIAASLRGSMIAAGDIDDDDINDGAVDRSLI